LRSVSDNCFCVTRRTHLGEECGLNDASGSRPFDLLNSTPHSHWLSGERAELRELAVNRLHRVSEEAERMARSK
jgi:hypothetical protein